MIVELGLSKRVTLLAGLSEAELQWCYRYCEALLAPSTVEGFGLPVVEGLLAGCRVVCSDIPAFRELGEDACRYVPLGGNDAEGAFAHAILAALQEPHREPILLSILSADVIAEQYVRLYRKLLTAQKATQGVVLAGSLPSAVSEREIL
jgi:glycosyltransferase involved in cell wall biosynthesis